MKHLWAGLFCLLSVALSSQAPGPSSAGDSSSVMVVGVAHDDSVMAGGISSGRQMAPGKVAVEPIAWLSSAGQWRKLSCADDDGPGPSLECQKFDRDYLSNPHDYTVVSADGKSAIVHVDRMALNNECFGIGGQATFSGGTIRFAAVAAESAAIFTDGNAAARLADSGAESVRRALGAAVGNKLDSTKELRVYSVPLEGQTFFVVQRAFQDYASKPEYTHPNLPGLDMIFAVGAMKDGKFQLMFWKENTGDDNEQILGLIHLKSGRDFLVTSSNNPEGNSFRVYGVRDGKIVLMFEGGGGGC
jgi:hypothetical protein